MKKIALIILLCLAFAGFARTQTMIEMPHPEFANLILCEVKDSAKADLIVYRTESGKLADTWNLMWKFKGWGFANFAVYITDDPFAPELTNEDTDKCYKIDATVYFTQNCEEVRYRHPGFLLNGVMKVQRRLYAPRR